MSIMATLKCLVIGLLLACPSVIESIPEEKGEVNCEEEQYVEVGQQGRIRCQITFEFRAVFWRYAGNHSHIIVFHNKETGEKEGLGYDNGQYEILEGGDLRIHNVSTKNERTYEVEVFDKKDVSVTKIITLTTFIRSEQERPKIDSCKEELCFERHTNRAMLKCSFNSARPPAMVEWYKRDDQEEYIKGGTKDDQIINRNPDGTFNSSVMLTIDSSQGECLTLWMCQSTWRYPEYTLRSSVMVDFYSDSTILKAPPTLRYAEIYRRTVLRCGNSGINVWRKIVSRTSIVTIGVHSYGNTKMEGEFDGLTVTANGDLEFRSVEMSHEGTYACVSQDGKSSRVTKTDMRVLILPTPAHVVVDGCDKSVGCRLSIVDQHILNCSLTGVRPWAELKWEVHAGNPLKIRRTDHYNATRGEEVDISISSLFEVSGDIYCEDEMMVTCAVSSPMSNWINQMEVTLIPGDTCKERQSLTANVDDEAKSSHHLVISLVVGASILTVCVTVVIVVCIIYIYRPRGKKIQDDMELQPQTTLTRTTDIELADQPGTEPLIDTSPGDQRITPGGDSNDNG